MRDEVQQELLQSDGPAIIQTTVDRYRTADHHHHGRNIKAVERDPRDQAAAVHHDKWEAEQVGPITHIAFEGEMDPAKYERERDRSSKNAAPHYEEVHYPPLPCTLKDKALLDQISGDARRRTLRTFREFPPIEEKLESAFEVYSRCRPLQPDRIAKGNSAKRHDACDRIAEKCGIEIL